MTELIQRVLLNPKEAAVRLNVPLSSLYDLVRAGHLPGIFLSQRRLRFDQRELEDFINKRRYKTNKAS